MKLKKKERPLKYEGETDYNLKEGHDAAWITVDGLSIHVGRSSVGTVIDVWEVGNEMETPISTLYIQQP